MLRFLLILLGLVAAALLAMVLLLAVYQERIVWQPPTAAGEPRRGDGEQVRLVEYVAADGQRLFGYLVAPPPVEMPSPEMGATAGSPRGAADDSTRAALAGRPRQRPSSARRAPRRSGRVLLAFHGNAETAADAIAWAQLVAHETGWSVLLAEYRGYAGLPGRPTYEGSRLDALAAYRWVRDSLGVAPDQIGIFGFSLGSAVASELASEVEPAVLLLQAPFTSARDMAGRAGPWPTGLLWRWIARVHFDTRARVAALDAPVWVIHGGRDLIIPVRMGRAVHAAARRKGRLVEIPTAGHNDLPSAGGGPYWRWIREALAGEGGG